MSYTAQYILTYPRPEGTAPVEHTDWRRTGPHLGRVPTFSPRAWKEFLVGAGRAKPGQRPPKTIRQGRNQQGARPCALTVCERPCVVMSDRPGLNPRAKFGKPPPGALSALTPPLVGWRGKARRHFAPPLSQCWERGGGQGRCVGYEWKCMTGRESLHTAHNGHPASFTRYNPRLSKPTSSTCRSPLIVNRQSLLFTPQNLPYPGLPRPSANPLNRYSLIVNRYSPLPPPFNQQAHR